MRITALAGLVAIAAGCGHPEVKPTPAPPPVKTSARRPEPRPVPSARPVSVEPTRIEIAEKVQFASGSSRILPGSFELLREVARVLQDHRGIRRVQLEGHTDDVGRPRRNKRLSRQRAESVRAFLVDEGVDPERLVAVGFGEERPVAENDTDAGREENRRVEFKILEQTDRVAKK